MSFLCNRDCVGVRAFAPPFKQEGAILKKRIENIPKGLY